MRSHNTRTSTSRPNSPAKRKASKPAAERKTPPLPRAWRALLRKLDALRKEYGRAARATGDAAFAAVESNIFALHEAADMYGHAKDRGLVTNLVWMPKEKHDELGGEFSVFIRTVKPFFTEEERKEIDRAYRKTLDRLMVKRAAAAGRAKASEAKASSALTPERPR